MGKKLLPLIATFFMALGLLGRLADGSLLLPPQSPFAVPGYGDIRPISPRPATISLEKTSPAQNPERTAEAHSRPWYGLFTDSGVRTESDFFGYFSVKTVLKIPVLARTTPLRPPSSSTNSA